MKNIYLALIAFVLFSTVAFPQYKIESTFLNKKSVQEKLLEMQKSSAVELTLLNVAGSFLTKYKSSNLSPFSTSLYL